MIYYYYILYFLLYIVTKAMAKLTNLYNTGYVHILRSLLLLNGEGISQLYKQVLWLVFQLWGFSLRIGIVV